MNAPAEYDLAYKGARRALTECMALQEGESLAVFHDESTRDFVRIIVAAANDLRIVVVVRCVSAEEQIRFAQAHEIADEDHEAISGARGIIIAFGAVPEGRAYRRRLMERSVDESRFVGVLPGATPNLLSSGVDIDYSKIESRCDDLAMALMAGDAVQLITRDPRLRGSTDTLHLSLGRFERPPITSTGIIQRGAWGNLPGGETFIAPLEGRATGAFILNGAFSGCVVARENPLRLLFDEGTLMRVDGPADTRTAFLKLLHWKPEVDPCSHLQLAELGIGVNDGLFELTGNALFDEKMNGTVHIAVGENAMYGGILESFLHEDFIAREPTLIVDGLPILQDGDYVLDPSQWRESYDSLRTRGSHLEEQFEVVRSGVHGHCAPNGRFRVRREVGAHRKCIYTIGDERVSPMLCKLYKLIPAPAESISVSSLRVSWQRSYGPTDVQSIRGLLQILETHHIVQCFPPE